MTLALHCDNNQHTDCTSDVKFLEHTLFLPKIQSSPKMYIKGTDIENISRMMDISQNSSVVPPNSKGI